MPSPVSCQHPAPPLVPSRDLTVATARRFQITIETREGDTVTLSAATTSLYREQVTADGSFTLRALQAEGLQIVVHGDLDERELAAIASLTDELAAVGRAFYGDDPAAALVRAQEIPDYGPLAGFSATFVRSDRLRLHENHPLPAAASLPPPPPLPAPAESSPLTGRWQEIRALLDTFADDVRKTAPAANPSGDVQAFARELQGRLAATLPAHPRLAPLLPAVTADGLERVAKELPSSVQDAAQALHKRLVGQIEDWLFGIPA